MKKEWEGVALCHAFSAFTFVIEATVATGPHHKDTVSCGFTWWTRNIPENELAPVYVEVEEYVTEPQYDFDWRIAGSFCTLALIMLIASTGGAGLAAGATAAACFTIVANVKKQQLYSMMKRIIGISFNFYSSMI